MKKLILVSLVGMFVASSAFARDAAWITRPTEPTIPEVVVPTEPVVSHDDEVMTLPELEGNAIVERPATTGYSTQKTNVVRNHHKSWWDRHGDDVIVGTAITALFVGVAVYAFNMEQSQNDPTKVTLMKF